MVYNSNFSFWCFHTTVESNHTHQSPSYASQTQSNHISPINLHTKRTRDNHPRQSPPGRNRFGHFHFSSIKHYWQHSQWSFVKHIELGFIVFILYRVTISPQLALAPISYSDYNPAAYFVNISSWVILHLWICIRRPTAFPNRTPILCNHSDPSALHSHGGQRVPLMFNIHNSFEFTHRGSIITFRIFWEWTMFFS